MRSRKIRHIFVVDDERVIAETVTTILQRSGFSAKSFLNLLEALLAAQSEVPDLLLCDAAMLQLSGIELAMRIKALCPECQILPVLKPVHPSDLLKQIRGLDQRPS